MASIFYDKAIREAYSLPCGMRVGEEVHHRKRWLMCLFNCKSGFPCGDTLIPKKTDGDLKTKHVNCIQ